MDKNLKRSYKCLDLPYNATAEEVESREKALIKILKAEYEKGDKSRNKKIDKVEKATELILESIKKNGMPKEEYHKFEVSKEALISLIIVFCFVTAICVFSFFIL